MKKKKMLIASQLKALLTEKSSFFDRSGVKIFTVGTNDELLKIHLQEKADVIVTLLDMPGTRSEDIFRFIRRNEDLREVSSILICKDTLAQRERCKECKTNAVFTLPVDINLLQMKIRQFINVSPRKSYRAVMAVAIQGKFSNKPMPFWTENISASGMLIRSVEPLSKGDAIFFSFFLPDGVHVSGYGEIARVSKITSNPDAYLYGIRFTNIEESARSAIEATVNK